MFKEGKLFMSALICHLSQRERERRGQQSQVALLTGETGDQSSPHSDVIY